MSTTQRPKYFFLQQGWYIPTLLSHLSRQRQWLLKNELQELLPWVYSSFELPFLILSTYPGDNFAGVIKSPVELCAEEQSTDTGSHFETGPQMWHTRILVSEIPFSTYAASQKFFWNFQEPVLPAAGPQTLEKYSKGYAEAQWHLLWLQEKCTVDLLQKESNWLWFLVLSLKERDLLLSTLHRTARWRVLRHVTPWFQYLI